MDVTKHFLLIWFDPTNSQETYHEDGMGQYIRQTIHPKKFFSDLDELVDYLTDLNDEIVILVLSNINHFDFVSIIDEIPQLDRFYLINDEKISMNQWKKCRGVFRTVESLAEGLIRESRRIQSNHLPISILSHGDTSKRDFNELPAAFLYSQILKEITFGFEKNENEMEELIHYLYEQNHTNEFLLGKINTFQRDYSRQSAIYWYTKEDFLYRILNQSLRDLNYDVVLKMSFFIRDLHQSIQTLFDQQANERKTSMFYRGQHMYKEEFEKLRHSSGGLLSFNSFLSTSQRIDVTEPFSDVGPLKNMISLCFEIEVVPDTIRIPFASVKNESHFFEEDEVLFSMHTVFRIGEIIENREMHRWHVKLKSTSDEDQNLSALTNFIRKETKGATGWHRLAQLMIRMGKWKEADDIYQRILKSTSPNDFIELALINNQFGYIASHLGQDQRAEMYYQRSLEITEKTLPTNYLDRAKGLNNIGTIELSRGHYSTALIFFKKALEMHRLSPLPIETDLATFHQNIGCIQNQLGKLDEAFHSFRKAQKINERCLPVGHPSHATIFSNLGQLSDHRGEYEQALNYYQQALKIQEKSLLPNHCDLAQTYNNIGDIQRKLGLFRQAFHSFEQALRTLEQTDISNQELIALINNNLATLYIQLESHEKALTCLNKTLDIQIEYFSDNHQKLSKCYSNISAAHKELGNFDQALQYAEKALEICQKIDPPIYPEQVQIYDNTGSIYYSMGIISEALFFHQQALDIHNRHVRIDHPAIARTYSNIGMIYLMRQQFHQARSALQRARDIACQSLPTDHPELRFYKEILATLIR